jgi:hypothetical protein
MSCESTNLGPKKQVYRLKQEPVEVYRLCVPSTLAFTLRLKCMTLLLARRSRWIPYQKPQVLIRETFVMEQVLGLSYHGMVSSSKVEPCGSMFVTSILPWLTPCAHEGLA